MTRQLAALFRRDQLTVHVGTFARAQDAIHVEVRLQAGVKHVSDVILGGVHAVNHSHEQGLAGRQRHLAAGSSLGLTRGGARRLFRGSHCRGRRRSAVSASGKSDGYNLIGVEGLHFPVDFKTNDGLRPAEILALENASVLQFARVRGGHACQQECKPGDGKNPRPTFHGISSVAPASIGEQPGTLKESNTETWPTVALDGAFPKRVAPSGAYSTSR